MRRALAMLWIALAALSCGDSEGRKRGPRAQAPSIGIISPWGGVLAGDVTILYNLTDRQSDRAAIQVDYSTDGGTSFQIARERPGLPSEGNWNLVSSPPPGTYHTYVWDSLGDLGCQIFPDVRIRMAAHDTATGKKVVSESFTVDNLTQVPQEVTGITDGIWSLLYQEITFEFSQPLDPATVIHQGGASDTFAVFLDTDATIGGMFTQVTGTATVQAGNQEIRFTPSPPLERFREIRFVLTAGIRDDRGNSLATGSSYPSDPLTYLTPFPDEAFQHDHVPGQGSSTRPFRADAVTDLWFLDFDTFGTFDSELSAHGLQGPGVAVAAYARDRVIGEILSVSSRHYGRDPSDGSPISGSFLISFVSRPPFGAPEVTYNRICFGRDMGNLLGTAWYDPGNNFMEDDCRWSNPALGVFSGGIRGLDSYLGPSLGMNDLAYVDGSYLLGTDPGRDARFLRIRAVIGDWGHSLAVVNSHEVGHSVGLDHDDSNWLNIMKTFVSEDFLSNTSVRFSARSEGILQGTLGQVP